MTQHDRMMNVFNNIKTDRIKNISKLNDRAFTRNRKMPLDELIRFILAKKGKTTTMELNNYFKEIKNKENTITKQAFSKQRKNLNPEVFVELNKDYVSNFYKYADVKKYKGHIITAIDGSYLEIPNTEELREEYQCKSTGQSIHRSIARALLSGIYDVENNIMIDSIIGKRADGERSLAKENIMSMLNIFGDSKDIITIFDRGYISIDMLLYLMLTDLKYLFRIPSSIFKKERSSLKSDDEIIEIELHSSRISNITTPELKILAKELKKINIRMVKIELSTGEIEYLVTNIDYDFMNTKEIGELYYKRWGIELAYGVIKNKLNVENISGKSKLVIEQDFYAQMLLFNMLEDIRANADCMIKDKKKEGLKYEYKVNMNILIGTFREYIVIITLEPDPEIRMKMNMDMIDEIVSNLVPIRPGRSYPRKPYTGINKYNQNHKRNS